LNRLVVIGLCIGLFWIASWYEAPKNYYDKSSYPYYPIELTCGIERIIDGDTIIVQCPKSLNNSEKNITFY